VRAVRCCGSYKTAVPCLEDARHRRQADGRARPGAPEIRIDCVHIVYDTHPLRERVGDKYAPAP
jgi:hypothetical protein